MQPAQASPSFTAKKTQALEADNGEWAANRKWKQTKLLLFLLLSTEDPLAQEGKKQAELLWSPNLVQYPPNGSDAPLSDPALSGLTERPEPFRLSVSKDFLEKFFEMPPLF